jgi:hypothetical protein
MGRNLAPLGSTLGARKLGSPSYNGLPDSEQMADIGSTSVGTSIKISLLSLRLSSELPKRKKLSEQLWTPRSLGEKLNRLHLLLVLKNEGEHLKQQKVHLGVEVDRNMVPSFAVPLLSNLDRMSLYGLYPIHWLSRTLQILNLAKE